MDERSLPDTLDADAVLSMIENLARLPYGLEPVDQRSHALQAAHMALEAGADSELVVAALLHDIGRHPAVEAAFPGMDHEDSARAFLDRHFAERVGWLAWAHVPAKIYLVETDPGYSNLFSEGSLASLPVQQEAVGTEVLSEFAAHPWRDAAVALRRWDDLAKQPGGPEPDPARLRRAIIEALDGRHAPGREAGGEGGI